MSKKKYIRKVFEAEEKFLQSNYLKNKDHYFIILNEFMEIIHPTTPLEFHQESTNSNILFHHSFSKLIQNTVNDSTVPYTFTKMKCFATDHDEYDGIIEQIFIDDIQYIVLCLFESAKHLISETSLEDFQSQHLLGQLASGYVHEIRNPLTSIKGFIQLLQAGIKQEEEYYKVIIAEIEKIEFLTNQLLEIGKPVDNEAIQLESCKSMIDDVIRLFQMNMVMRRIDFQVVVNDPIQINCNRKQVKQVLINIIKNAAEAMDYEGSIYIRDQYPNPTTYELIITDDGPGIPNQIIEQFGKPIISTKQMGTGLGLMLSKKMIEKNNGSMHITNNNDGVGTSIYIRFPLN